MVFHINGNNKWNNSYIIDHSGRLLDHYFHFKLWVYITISSQSILVSKLGVFVDSAKESPGPTEHYSPSTEPTEKVVTPCLGESANYVEDLQSVFEQETIPGSLPQEPVQSPPAANQQPEVKPTEARAEGDHPTERPLHPCRVDDAANQVATPTTGGATPTTGGATPTTGGATPSVLTNTVESSPDVDRPIPGELRLSQNAINLRLHRAMRIDSKGNSKVSSQIRDQFHSKKGKLRIQQVFQSCGYDVDWGCQTFFHPL